MDLRFIDVAGLRAVIKVHRELAQQGRNLYLVHPSPLLVRMLENLDLNYLLRPNAERSGSPPVIIRFVFERAAR